MTEKTVTIQEQDSKWHNVYPMVLGGVILVLVLVPLVINAAAPHPVGSVYDAPEKIEDFELPQAEGGTFRLSDYRGKTLVIYFGYTSCPDVCPTTLYDLRRARAELGDTADEVEVVFITVDPAVDDADTIERYLSSFDESFIGLTGTTEQLEPVADQFDIAVLPDEETVQDYGITHTTSVFVVNSEGYLKLRMHYGQPYDRMADDIRLVAKGRL